MQSIFYHWTGHFIKFVDYTLWNVKFTAKKVVVTEFTCELMFFCVNQFISATLQIES